MSEIPKSVAEAIGQAKEFLEGLYGIRPRPVRPSPTPFGAPPMPIEGPFSKGSVGAMPGSLAGANVRPIEGAHFSGTVWIPKSFPRLEGETDNDYAGRWMDAWPPDAHAE